MPGLWLTLGEPVRPPHVSFRRATPVLYTMLGRDFTVKHDLLNDGMLNTRILVVEVSTTTTAAQASSTTVSPSAALSSPPTASSTEDDLHLWIKREDLFVEKRKFVVKQIVTHNRETYDQVKEEVDVGRHLRTHPHKNVVRTFGYGTIEIESLVILGNAQSDKQHMKVYEILQEYCEGIDGSLVGLGGLTNLVDLGKIFVARKEVDPDGAQLSRPAWTATYQLFLHLLKESAEGLLHLHRHGIVHRDLKLTNIFLCPARVEGELPTPKIGDFGWSKNSCGLLAVLKSNNQGNMLGWSYEKRLNVHPRFHDAAATDVFALGASFFDLLFTGHPLDYPSAHAKYEQIKDPVELRDFICGLLQAECVACDLFDNPFLRALVDVLLSTQQLEKERISLTQLCAKVEKISALSKKKTIPDPPESQATTITTSAVRRQAVDLAENMSREMKRGCMHRPWECFYSSTRTGGTQPNKVFKDFKAAWDFVDITTN